MLAGVSIEKSIAVFGKRGGTRTKDMVAALREFGFVVPSEKLIRLKAGQTPPAYCIAKICWYKGDKRSNQSHWVLKWEGKYYDPEDDLFIMPSHGKFTSYLPILENENR
jgi:hypothetical protein